jgi:hypothetical protein
MNIESKLSGHWTDDELIAHLYGVGPEDGHITACQECRSRLCVLQAHRQQSDLAEEVSVTYLAAQRRRIYAALAKPLPWWSGLQLRRLASAGAIALVLAGSVLYYSEYQRQQDRDHLLSDAQLALDVSRLSENPEARPTAPLEALFEE